jgi:hypothetical protein
LLMPRRPPPRIFIIPATDAEVAIVIRRGPSSWYHLLKWDMEHDKLEPGAWFRGRIYPEKCDVSPDGALLLYLAHQGRKVGTSYTDAWTAVSRLPWLTALGLWPWGTTYGGGGRFLGKRHLRLRAGCAFNAHPDHPGLGLEVEFGDSPAHRSTREVDGADWSGRDCHGELIFAREGKIFRRLSSRRKDRLVADLNGMLPDPKPAPAWASRPLAMRAAKK